MAIEIHEKWTLNRVLPRRAQIATARAIDRILRRPSAISDWLLDPEHHVGPCCACARCIETWASDRTCHICARAALSVYDVETRHGQAI